MSNNKIPVISFNRERQVVTTTSEVVLVACLVRQQLLQNVVTVHQYTAEEFVVAVDGQLPYN